MTPVPDFPNELVEAAAKAAMEAEPGQNWECATAKEADVYLRDSLAVLAAVVPLIEQRVIDRLAREAGEPPRGPYAIEEPEQEAWRDGWREGAACGVAAERARWELAMDDVKGDAYLALLTGVSHEAMVRHLLAIHTTASAALAPERTGEKA